AVAAASGSAVGVASAATLKHAAPHQAAVIKPVTLGSLKPTHTKTLVTTNTAPGVTPPAPARCHPKSAALSSHNPVPSLQYKPQLQSVVPAVTGKSEICHSTGPTHGHGSAHKRRHHHRHHHHHPHDKGTQH